MSTPKIVLTLVTVAALGATPAVASGAPGCPSGAVCRIALNHNELFVASPAA